MQSPILNSDCRSSLAVAFTYYNEGSMLGDTIDGLLAQQSAPDAVLVYDDASSDLAINHVPEDPRIFVMRGDDNLGPAEGRNKLLAACSCDYIHFHDSDDYFSPHWCAAVRAKVCKERPDVVFTDVRPVKDSADTEIDVGWNVFGGIEPEDLIGFCIKNAVLPACITLSTAFARLLGGYPTALHQSEDYLFSILIAAATPRVAFDLRPLVVVRQRIGSRSKDRIAVFRDGTRALEIVAPHLPKRYLIALARRAIANGRTLYQLGDLDGADSAFALASRFDCSWLRFIDQPAHYRLVAQIAGPLTAERLGAVWRGMRCRIG